jgi:hypothetical protein
MPGCRLLRAFGALFALATAPASAGNATLPETGRIEIVTWMAGLEQYKFTHDCMLSDKSVHCTGTGQWPQTVTKVVLDDTVEAGVLDMKYDATTNYTDPACSSTYVISSREKLTLDESGTGTGSWMGGTGTWVAASAKCATLIGRKDEHAPEEANVRVTWRVVEGASQQAGFGDGQIRAALWKQLGQAEGPLARKCFDESLMKLNESHNAEMKERIEAVAYQQHVIETFAAAADVDDFDPQWME